MTDEQAKSQIDKCFDSMKVVMAFGKTMSKYSLYKLLKEEQSREKIAPYNEANIHVSTVRWLSYKN